MIPADTSVPSVPVIIVDDRWQGEHGIGRFATEIIKRLTGPWLPLTGDILPTSKSDIVNKHRLSLTRHDTVFTPGFNAGISRARQIIVIHDLIHLRVKAEKSLSKTVFYNTVVRHAIRRAGVVLTVSETSASAIAAWMKSPTVRVVVVGNGRSSSFLPVGVNTEFDRPTFIYVGNLKAHKNVQVVFDAIRLRPDFHLLVVTNDVARARAWVQHKYLHTQVTVRTAVSDDELASMYRGAAGVLLPSLLEGFGLPALEAMSCGTRVAFWAGCESVSEICQGTGVAVESATDPAEWASALDALKRMSDQGPVTMATAWEALYDWDTVAGKVQRVLDEVCS